MNDQPKKRQILVDEDKLLALYETQGCMDAMRRVLFGFGIGATVFAVLALFWKAMTL